MKVQHIPHKVHFVGIGGIGMSSLAQWLLARGYQISGSDRQNSEIVEILRKKGAKIAIGHSADNVTDVQLVVRTSAVSLDNVEVARAVANGIPVMLREELLGIIFNSYATRVAVCGTHGKTTVTAMIHHILKENNIAHTCFLGGLYQGENFSDGGDIVVAEACEYNRSFLHLSPTICCCLNAEYDHPDCFADEESILQAFEQVISSATDCAILPTKLKHLAKNKVISYNQQYGAVEVECRKEGVFCKINQTSLSMPIVGKHNITNAQAAIAVSNQLGISLANAATSLSSFSGVSRRWSVKGVDGNIIVDYAHHPTEIKCAVSTALSICKGKVYCLFQPHTYSRTKAFWQEFATCFKEVEKVGYLPIFAARESPIDSVNSCLLAEFARSIGVEATYLSSFEQAVQFAHKYVSKNDILLVLGAGDICTLADMI